MTTRVLVSPEALTGLVSRLRGVQAALADDVRPSAADVGSPELADALADFSRNWGKKRHSVLDDLGEATQCILTTRDTFVERDGCLARGLGGRR